MSSPPPPRRRSPLLDGGSIDGHCPPGRSANHHHPHHDNLYSTIRVVFTHCRCDGDRRGPKLFFLEGKASAWHRHLSSTEDHETLIAFAFAFDVVAV